jgi:mono/diheme cytochrome c family protein
MEEGTALVAIKTPESYSQNAQIGQRLFKAKCADCHGPNAVGQAGVAPPLIHVIYEPNHHGDESFQRAVALGVRAHHWKFGNMPAVAGLTRAEVKSIIAYVRELQRHNGIF